jgi:hypothetical protein
VPEGAARFVHDPKAGRTAGERLRIDHLPADAPRKAIDGISAAQQADDLAMLVSLSQAGAGTGAPAAAGSAPANPVDQLASWLLAQTDLTP